MASALPASLARLFSSCTIVELQSPNKLVLMEGEAVWSVVQLDKRPHTPYIESVQPLALLAGSRLPQAVYVHGAHLEGRGATTSAPGTDPAAGAASTPSSHQQQPPGGCQLLVRSQGRFLQQGSAVPVPHAAGAAADAGEGPSSGGGKAAAMGWWRVGVDASALQPGLAVVECQNGRTLSNWRPVLVVDDPGVHHEVLQLQPLQAQFGERVQALVGDLALLVQLQGVEAQRQQEHELEMERQRLQLLRGRRWQQQQARGRAAAARGGGAAGAVRGAAVALSDDDDDEEEEDEDVVGTELEDDDCDSLVRLFSVLPRLVVQTVQTVL